MSNSTTRFTSVQDQIAQTAKALREADEQEQRARAEFSAFLDQMAWNATVTGIQERYGIDPTLITPRGKSRWTNRGMFEGPVSLLGLRLETRAVLTEVDDDERILGYKTVKQVALVRRTIWGNDKPVSRAEIAAHLEKLLGRHSGAATHN